MDDDELREFANLMELFSPYVHMEAMFRETSEWQLAIGAVDDGERVVLAAAEHRLVRRGATHT